MPITLMPLPYAQDALAPAISAETLKFHHGKHHKGYVDKTNGAIKGTGLASASLEEVVAAARRNQDRKLFDNAAQAWNHGFYWMSLSPAAAAPSGDLAAAIARDFGSHDALLEELAKQGEAHFASGWVWLALSGGKLAVEQTHDAETLADREALPLLVVDLWEHAYYLDRQNDRAAYLKAVLGEVLNWDFAAERFATRRRWTYPAEKVAEGV